jgi:hypothetical protein
VPTFAYYAAIYNGTIWVVCQVLVPIQVDPLANSESERGRISEEIIIMLGLLANYFLAVFTLVG